VAQSALLLALLSAVVFVQTPGGSVFFHVLQKLGHPVTFAVICLLVMSLRGGVGRGERRSRFAEYASAFTITVALGSATEIAQHFVHRDPSVLDVLRDALGAAVALAARLAIERKDAPSAFGRRVRGGAATVCLVGLVIIVAPVAWCLAAYVSRDLRFPVLWQFNSALDMYFLSGRDLRLEDGSPPTLWNIRRRAAAVYLPLRNKLTSGLAVFEPYPDWRGFSVLMIDVGNPGSSSLQLTVRVHDRWHDQQHADRFNRTYVLAERTRRVIAIPLQEIAAAPRGRSMDLQHITNIGIFRGPEDAPGALLLNRIWLQ
jgi:VanZ family protein